MTEKAPEAQDAPERAPEAEEDTESGESGDIEALKAERDRLQDQHLRARAELANYRKRAVRERVQAAAAAKRDLVAALLPALDALDLAVEHGEADPGSLLEGLKAARDVLQQALASQNVERIPAPAGSAYDPDLHQAQAVVESAEHPQGAIVEELRPGYRVGDLVARHSQVLVAKRPTGKKDQGAGSGEREEGEDAPAGEDEALEQP